MAKLKNKLAGTSTNRTVIPGFDNVSDGGGSKISLTRELALQMLSPNRLASPLKGISFGELHTKASSSSQSGSRWTGLLNAASGGVSSVLGGGLLSSGGLGFIGKLLSLFGGSSKAPPAVPVEFHSPLPQQHSFDVSPRGAGVSSAQGVHALNGTASTPGVYQHLRPAQGQHLQSLDVVQIVKRALLTSSSLNDVISEI